MQADDGRKTFKILSLDGGGTFALIQAKVLADLYPGESGHEVLSHFDLVAACSGGAIVTAALIEGYAPGDILDLFLSRRNRLELFSKLRWYERLIRIVSQRFSQSPFGPAFSTERKLAFLHRVLPRAGTCPLHELDSLLREKIGPVRADRGDGRQGIDFLFVSYDYDRDRARMLRSRATSPAANFPKDPERSTLAEAAHASSTAPLNWFNRPAEFGGRRYWDGAMTGYNNPVLAGVIEALAAGRQREEIGVLAIGTSTSHIPQAGNGESGGILSQLTGFADDLTKAGKLIIADPPDAHTFISHAVLGGGMPASPAQCPDERTAVVRMNPVVQPVFDAVQQEFVRPQGWSRQDFERLKALDIATTEDADVALIQRLADDWMDGRWYNQPVRGGGGLYEVMYNIREPAGMAAPIVCEIGHSFYQDAKRAWQSM